MARAANWINQFTVVNCGAFWAAQVANNVYICPATGGAYRHVRPHYLGLCWNRSARKVAEVWGVVDVHPALPGLDDILWNNGPLSDADLKAEARRRNASMHPHAAATNRVFVLDKLIDTNFHKHTPGGMLNSKNYFDVAPLGVTNAAALASAIDGQPWSFLL